MLLPVLKIAFRNLFSCFCHKSDEKTPPIVVFNADVGNALFVTYCLQYNPSIATTVGLMTANAAQVALSIKDVNAILARLAAISAQVKRMQRAAPHASARHGRRASATDGKEADDMMERSIDIFARYGGVVEAPTANRDSTRHEGLIVVKTRRHSLVGATPRSFWAARPPRPILVVPVAPPVELLGSVARRNSSQRAGRPRRSTSSLELRSEGHAAQLERLEQQYTNQFRKLLHVTEYSILIEYAEVIIPFVYCKAIRLSSCA